MIDWMELEPYFTEVALTLDGEWLHWNDIMTFPVNQHGAENLNDLIIVLTQMRDYIEEDRCNAKSFSQSDHVQSVRGTDNGIDTTSGFSPAKRQYPKRRVTGRSYKRRHRDRVGA